ncbi:SDR family NAD(P)-dependent oxidoreductase [Haliea sp. E1-2-M8]|uniref:SDR family NAD(P)-dependent oxidoreductase n=1 Tax=Haliea sp. E1-2-M8 TaxID=3064706 RepID=UPI002725F971|nr:SDR family NAD(P)-dependent oxidoreductase [Haliea sp. E1-2-M8]MDO8862646.1 SDR family NAD(P)-dependent oxidoreductase [Haliea sp. E1-2-M8]
MREFGFESTTAEVIAGQDLSGRVALVTGASAGLGVETARALAGAGATVWLLARDRAKLDAALATLRAESLPGRLESALLDLADLDQVRGAAEGLLEACPRIDLLINNAGVMACPHGETAQGFEMQLGTNHIGHFLFTCLLLPALKAGAANGREARVVNLSSAGHRFSALNFDDPNYRQRPYEKWQAYGQSKTANVLFSVALDARTQGAGVRSFAVHPGAISTELGRHMDKEDMARMAASFPGGKMAFKTVPQGAATSVWAATAPELEGRGGLYLEDCHIAEAAGADSLGGVQAWALDPVAADRLWQLSEEWVGQSSCGNKA